MVGGGGGCVKFGQTSSSSRHLGVNDVDGPSSGVGDYGSSSGTLPYNPFAPRIVLCFCAH